MLLDCIAQMAKAEHHNPAIRGNLLGMPSNAHEEECSPLLEIGEERCE